jgi:hypothetical protein
LGIKEAREHPVWTVFQDYPDKKGNQGLWDLQVLMVYRDWMDCQDSQEKRVTEELMDSLVHQDHPVCQEPKVRRVFLEYQGKRESQEEQPQELKENQDYPDFQE